MRRKSRYSARVFSAGSFTTRAARLTAFSLAILAALAIAFATVSRARRLDSTKLPAQSLASGSSEESISSDFISKTMIPRPSPDDTSKQTGDSKFRSERRRDNPDGKPREWKLNGGAPFAGDLRQLPQTRTPQIDRHDQQDPDLIARRFVPSAGLSTESQSEDSAAFAPSLVSNAPAPPPSANFDGLDFQNWGSVHPPAANGDVGPTYYIQAINTSIGIFNKTNGNLVAGFGFNTFMSQGQFGNLCDTNNVGDPVVLYDTFEDRWVITDFAYQVNGGGVVNPPGAYQCFAVSKSGDPVSGGWNFYSLHLTDLFNDYPKFGIWPDGIYMSANMFGFPAGAPYQNPRVWALNKAQMYAGASSVQSISFDAPSADFTILPSNARLQTGTPPPGRPNLFLGTSQFLNAVTVYKFHVDWDHVSLSTFTGPDIPVASTSRPNAVPASAPSLGGNSLDVVGIRAMMQNQYTNLAGVESLWATHTVRRADVNGFAAPRFYQVPVTGGIVGANVTQAATFDPDGANVIHRFMPSLAVDRAGNMALGYSTSNSTTQPAIKYAGRLSTDPINTFSQSEQVLIQGTGTQTGNCEGAPCTRWGDYSSMTVDPDGCTFWYTNMYYQTDGINYRTRIGSFTLPQCTTAGAGTLQGTVTSSAGNVPIAGATISFGSRSTVTDGSGFYSFTSLAPGTYPSVSATFPGYTSSTFNGIVIAEGQITSENFVLTPGPDSACLTDTTQLDFQRGVWSSVDVTSSPGDMTLASTASLDQQNLSVAGSGFSFNSTLWIGQTFQPAVTGQLTRAELFMFCSNCTGTTPNLNVSIRATSSDLPTGPDLAVATIPGFSSGVGGFYAANFASPPTLVAGTRYAVIVRPVSNPSVGSYAYLVSPPNAYANGRWVASVNSGSTWLAPTTGNPLTPRDLGFKTFMKTGFLPAGNFTSGVMDANPHTAGAVTWTTLSWNASVPGGTTLKFQVAASNSPTGPFTFVGPDGTAATFFDTSGASLVQFSGNRYLKYLAYLATSSANSTPTLNDVTVCFSNTVPTTLAVSPAIATYGGVVNLSATLTDGASPLSGKSVSFTINGNSAGSALTDASGVASVTNVSVAGINANTYPTGVGASFAGDAPYMNSSSANSFTVNKADSIIDVTPYNVPFDGDPHTATGIVTGVNGEALVGLSLSGTTHTAAANYAGDPWKFMDVTGNYNDANGTADDLISMAKSSTTVTVGNATYDGNSHGGTASVTGAGGLTQTLQVTYTGRNSTTYGPSSTPPSNAGEYRASASFAGDGNHSGSSDAKDFTIVQATSVTTVNCPVSMISTGLALTPCTAAATGANGLNVSLAVGYLNNVLPGTATANATYGGDNNHSSSTGSSTFTITAVSAPTGNFVIGDLNAVIGKKVTFWGAQWPKLNSLSGGSAPASFKGFANSASTNPASCGGTWTSDPGNGSGPPTDLPEFITVIVSSSITKNGATINGNNYKMVIVKTDPGYRPDSGHTGTGTVVSVVCQ